MGVFLKLSGGGGNPKIRRKTKTVYTLINKRFRAKERGYVHTMASTRTTTRTIRIENEAAEYFKGKPLNRAVESLYGLLRSGEMSFDGEKLSITSTGKTSGCTQKNTENLYTPIKKSLDSIGEMASLMQVSTDGLLTALNEALEEGTLYYSNGKLVNPLYEEFERACKGKDKKRILDGLIRSL